LSLPAASVINQMIKYRNGQWNTEQAQIAREYPLTIYVNGDEFATLVCTPSDLEEMVVGFLASEGIIRFYHEINEINIDADQGLAYVELTHQSIQHKDFYAKRFIGSCCGKSRQSFYFYNDVRTAKTIRTAPTITVQSCFALIEALQNQSKTFQSTGGVHNAALCSEDQILTLRTDIGRHNALDKLYGNILMSGMGTADKIIAFSGRISSEVLLKVSKIGVGILLSKSAPSDLAIQMADELKITTVGFIRNGELNIYTHPDRIRL
jgi:FdhD protein